MTKSLSQTSPESKLSLREIATKAIDKHLALQKPAELELFLKLLHSTDKVIEIGCDAGGTTWAMQQVGCHVIGINLSNAAFSSGYKMENPPNVLIEGNSHDRKTVKILNGVLGTDLVDILFIDGDHTYDGCWQDFETYNVYCNGLVFFHDVCKHPNNPIVAVDRVYKELSNDYPHTEIIVSPEHWGGIGILDISNNKKMLQQRLNECLYAK